MNHRTWLYTLALSLALSLTACRGSRGGQASGSGQPNSGSATTTLAIPEPHWERPAEGPYNESAPIAFNLLHTRLNVRFDWAKQWLLGTAELKLVPHFFAQDSLILDAKGFDINAIALQNGQARQPLPFAYDGQQIRIALGRAFTRADTVRLFIDYIAKPNELKAEGGSAITDRRGLYFINPDGADPNKPRQIWTQGETESASCWFPTLDKPNQNTTQEMFITVDSQYRSLSNGQLVASTPNPDGTRTDYWRMDLPHAPYLFMMAIGEFAVTTEQWRGIDVMYYVEPEYEPYARLIFGNTPEMLTFFSQRFGVDYPWAKYAQVVVREFVSGAMENTTATVHFEGLQRDARAYLDETHEDIIAHELVHHWFGDLVTCESWANLTLNEGFATYGEYLWLEHKYGPDEADHHIDSDLSDYLAESATKREPLIRFHYIHRDDMFDAHSYQKGGRVLHMLRNRLGDDAFFAGIKLYLTRHAYTPVEIDELRMAFEDVCGHDLKPFFDTWYTQPGHPEVAVSYAVEGEQLRLQVAQTQDVRYQPMYALPLRVQVFTPNAELVFPATVSTADTTLAFTLPAGTQVLNVDFDSEHRLLADVVEEKPRDWWMLQYARGKNYKQRQLALRNLAQFVDAPEVLALYRTALKDEFWGLRELALGIMGQTNLADAAIIAEVETLATRDPKAAVRAEALALLSSLDEAVFTRKADVLRNSLNDSSYAVVSVALAGVYSLSKEEGLKAARSLQDISSDDIRASVAEIFLAQNDPRAGAYTQQVLEKMANGYEKMFLIQKYGMYIKSTQDSSQREMGLSWLKTTAKTHPAWFIRLMATQALITLRDQPGVREFVEEIKRAETNPELRKLYEDGF